MNRSLIDLALHDAKIANEKGEQDFAMVIAILNQLTPAPGDDSPEPIAMHLADVLRERMETRTIPASIHGVLQQLDREVPQTRRDRA